MTTQGLQIFELAVEADEEKQRLDHWLTARLPDLSRSRLRQLIDEGGVICTKTGKIFKKPSVKTRLGDVITVTVPEAVDALPQPENIALDIAFEDDDLVVVNKPAGMTVHPAAGVQTGTLVNALLHHCGDSLSGIGGVKRPGIVHRIDKDTSGLLVVAKNDLAHHGLAEQFAAHTIHRRYLAAAWGRVAETTGKITGAIGRNPHNRKKMDVVERGGKDAVTHYERLRLYGLVASLVQCQLETGRTHQIRVHMTHVGNPLVGDPLYGRCPPVIRKRLSKEARAHVAAFNRQALHAAELGFIHPRSGEMLQFVQEQPQDFKELLGMLEKC